MGIVPSKRRWERKMRARDRSVKFQGHNAANNVDKVTARESDQYLRISYVFHLNSHTFSYILQQSTLDRKKKNFTFSRKFPFMKSKDDKNEDGSDQEREYLHTFFYVAMHSIDIEKNHFCLLHTCTFQFELISSTNLFMIIDYN